MMDELTLEQVNAAIKRHLQPDDLKIAIVTGQAEKLRCDPREDAPSPITYPSPKPDAVLAEDRAIAAFPLGISAERVAIVPVAEAFER